MCVFKKAVHYFNDNGVLLLLERIVIKSINKIYNLLIFKRNDIDVDCTANIRGINCISIGQNFHAGKHLWLDAVRFYQGESFTPKIIVGNNVGVQDFVHIGATNYISIGDNVLFASKVYVTDHNHGIYDGENQSNPYEPPFLRKLTRNREVIIEKNVWIGECVTVLPGVHIGEGSLIGANAVVASDIPAFSIAVGTPARVVKSYDKKCEKWVNV